MNATACRAIAVACLLSASAGPVAAQPTAGSISAANINVIQNDAGNNPSSVTVTVPNSVTGSAGAFTVLPSANRGDYDVQIGSTAVGNPSAGVLISSVRQNGRNNSVAPNVGGNTGNRPDTGTVYATSAVERTADNRFYIPVFGASTGADASLDPTVPTDDNGAEFNINVSAAYFPFAAGWVGGYARNVTNNAAINDTNSVFSPGVSIATGQVTQADPSAPTNGQFTVNLAGVAGVPANASQTGILLVAGAKNEDNYALARADADGTFAVFVKDNGSNGGGFENDPFAFVYVPADAPGVTSGRVVGEGASLALVAGVGADGAGAATVTDGGLGTVYLTIAGVTSEDQGVLVISAEGGQSLNIDNIVSYEWDDANDRFVVQTRDLPGAGLQDVGATEGIFSFAFIPTPVPEPATVFGAAAAALAGGRWVRRRVAPRA